VDVIADVAEALSPRVVVVENVPAFLTRLVKHPRTGEPVLVLNSYAAPLARRDSWLERIEVVDDYAESPTSGLPAFCGS